MTPELPFQAVIFDMDGLVLDSETGYFVAWQQAAAEMGYSLDMAFCAALSGSHGPEISQRLLARFGTDFGLDRFYRLSGQYWREQVQCTGIPVKQGFYEVLQWLKDLRIPYCLATNSRRADAEQCLIWAGLDGVFEHLLTREDVARPKPAADIFIKAAQVLKIPPRLCLVLEDSPIGVRAAVEADCACLFIPSVLPADTEASRLANGVMPDLSAVADFISAGFDHPL